MKPRAVPILAGVLILNLALTVYLLATRGQSAPQHGEPAAGPGTKSAPAGVRDLEQSLVGIRAELRDLQAALTGAPNALPGEADEGGNNRNQRALVNLADRLTAMESSLTRLQSAMDGVSLEAASAERAKLFAGDDGHLKADEYFAADKFAIAGEGYLKFLEAHPEHPDHRSILERARTAFTRAGYSDKAIWAQEELMRIYPETRRDDLMTLAHLQKDARNYGEAARVATEAASLDQTSGRYWDLLYAAWFTELEQGPQAGLASYRNVQQQIMAAGYGDQKLGARAQEKIEELERRIAGDQ